MQPSRHQCAIVRFGPFEVDVEQRVLRKDGVRIKLQTQPFQILAALLEKPGTVVTRDELRRHVWPENTFVDFEHGLNASVARLRQALCDSAEKPRYIETLPRQGYRFIGQVEPDAREIATNASEHHPPGKHRIAASISATRILVLGAGLTAGLIAVLLPWSRSDRGIAESVPLTAFQGREMYPALSPDDSHVAFSWNGEKQDNFDIYTMRIGADRPVRLTSDPADDLSPVWSPDGRMMAFVRRLSHDRGELVIMPATGGPEHKIHELRDRELREIPSTLLSLAWSPDGQWIAASHRAPGSSSERIYLFSPAGEALPLTSPTGAFGDHTPAFSPNGGALAFSRKTGVNGCEIAVLTLDKALRPSSHPRLVTRGVPWSVKPAWSSDGSRILYLSAQDAGAWQELRMVSPTGDHASVLSPFLKHEPFEISVGRHLVYTRRLWDMDIWRARVSHEPDAPLRAERLLTSTWMDKRPRYSPDGSKIAFISSRSGTAEIWVATADGSNLVRITSFGGPLLGWPSWSPDARWLAFHVHLGQADLFVVPAVGGEPRRLTTHSADDDMPSYSRDGQWINFGSTRSGQQEIWRMPAAGGEPVQLTSSGGWIPLESVDGNNVYYAANDGSGIRSVPVTGGKSATVTGPVQSLIPGFAVTAAGIYYPAPPHTKGQRFIRLFSFSTRESSPVALAGDILGLTVSPDSSYIVFDQIDELGSDLMLVENFQP